MNLIFIRREVLSYLGSLTLGANMIMTQSCKINSSETESDSTKSAQAQNSPFFNSRFIGALSIQALADKFSGISKGKLDPNIKITNFESLRTMGNLRNSLSALRF